MYTKLQKINEGFTIVETLIVLAIAALIITIILIAVPDLQRSSRNTDILHDAQNVASGVQTYEGNNSGGLPAAPATNPETGPTIAIGTSGATATAHVQGTDSVFWSSGAHAVKYSSPSTTVSATTITQGQIIVDVGSNCGTVGATNTTIANPRAVAVLYPIEGSSTASSTVGCTQE